MGRIPKVDKERALEAAARGSDTQCPNLPTPANHEFEKNPFLLTNSNVKPIVQRSLSDDHGQRSVHLNSWTHASRNTMPQLVDINVGQGSRLSRDESSELSASASRLPSAVSSVAPTPLPALLHSFSLDAHRHNRFLSDLPFSLSSPSQRPSVPLAMSVNSAVSIGGHSSHDATVNDVSLLRNHLLYSDSQFNPPISQAHAWNFPKREPLINDVVNAPEYRTGSDSGISAEGSSDNSPAYVISAQNAALDSVNQNGSNADDVCFPQENKPTFARRQSDGNYSVQYRTGCSEAVDSSSLLSPNSSSKDGAGSGATTSQMLQRRMSMPHLGDMSIRSSSSDSPHTVVVSSPASNSSCGQSSSSRATPQPPRTPAPFSPGVIQELINQVLCPSAQAQSPHTSAFEELLKALPDDESRARLLRTLSDARPGTRLRHNSTPTLGSSSSSSHDGVRSCKRLRRDSSVFMAPGAIDELMDYSPVAVDGSRKQPTAGALTLKQETVDHVHSSLDQSSLQHGDSALFDSASAQLPAGIKTEAHSPADSALYGLDVSDRLAMSHDTELCASPGGGGSVNESGVFDDQHDKGRHSVTHGKHSGGGVNYIVYNCAAGHHSWFLGLWGYTSICTNAYLRLFKNAMIVGSSNRACTKCFM